MSRQRTGYSSIILKKRVGFDAPVELLERFDAEFDNRSAALVNLMEQAVSGRAKIISSSAKKAEDYPTPKKRVGFNAPLELVKRFDAKFSNRSASLINLMEQAVSRRGTLNLSCVKMAAGYLSPKKLQLCKNALMLNFYHILDNGPMDPIQFDQVMRFAVHIEEQLQNSEPRNKS